MRSGLQRTDLPCLPFTLTIRWVLRDAKLRGVAVTSIQRACRKVVGHGDRSALSVQEVDMPEKHRFPMRKYRLTREALQADPSVQHLIEVREVLCTHPSGFPMMKSNQHCKPDTTCA